MSIYELGIFGNVSANLRSRLNKTVSEMVADFGLTVGTEVMLHDAQTITTRDPFAAFAAAYFVGEYKVDEGVVAALSKRSLPVIPIVSPTGDFAKAPNFLHATNGLRIRDDDYELKELAAVLLECVGLLRRQRRVFVSYRRVESRSAAMQLHDLLTSRGFDVFLDTHDIRPGEPFQDVLWHRLCDSDVMVMLDTPTYFNSKWTRQEIGRARAKEIQVLRVVWPDHFPTKLTDMSETVYLDGSQLEAVDGPLVTPLADELVLKVERLRSQSIASRYMSITGKLRADVERIGAKIEGIGAYRAISIRLLDDSQVWAYPIVGVPTADLFHDVATKASASGQVNPPILVYDHVGIRNVWATHLQWLDENIKSVRAIKVSEAGYVLAAWEI